jgi:hypothetical protein
MPDKPHTWRGEIDRTNKTFRLVPGTEETGFHAPSRIVIRGEITSNGKKTSLKIKLQPTGSVFFNNAALITITIVTAILIPNNTFFSNWWIAIVWLLLLMGNFVRLNNDLNKTTKKLIQYFRALTDGA